MAEEAQKKEAKKVYTLEDIQFNEANKTMAILACIPIVGLVLMFVEKDDKFVRYMGAQFAIAGVASIVLSIIPIINILGFLFNMVVFVLMIVAMVKASKGERFDFPVISGFALKLMASI
ncbi:MAG: DUF4870 domain-containing protein [Candidatus Dojkabacteria bacterium]|nr:DUF4870 domain-containing protein [Candidatus Dojkabacteria bacterium]